MRKSFFLSILAVGALVAGCAKSEVVDTKFNEEIGFNAYLGKAAQTKASVETAKTIGAVGVYGYYTGAKTWNESTEANLWETVLELKVGDNGIAVQPTGDDIRYWANATDNYTFLAYAPYAKVTAPTTTDNPTVAFTVNADIPSQVDLLYANAKGTTADFDGTVGLTFKHALSRITVKASAAEGEFKFDVKKITLAGDFNVTGNLPLATGVWGTPQPATDGTTFVIFDNTPEGETKYAAYSDANALTTAPKDYAGTNNYLMVIPTVSTEANPVDNAKLNVIYTTYYAGQESVELSQTIDVPMNFEQGKAYSINLNFSHDDKPIQFSVSVENWAPETDGVTDEIDQNENIVA